ncbi:hypothetical protein CALVIDRAFT_566570 [Calocera viscosa TUFC12733]|uniref:Uncharacterized protein n=1 Tax=Calocera viscosa (strain TUFC12733) TaxID=1330018 RepID=A0A167J802_CALVF|nr:hypothetical protein CALVIDRAFT_566570 [Calocera viscosa TUFC12733]
MSFGDIDSTDLDNLFSDMKVASFVDQLARPLRWVASGMASMANADQGVLSHPSNPDVKQGHTVVAFPVVLQKETSRR